MLTPRKLQSRPMRRKHEPQVSHERHPQALKPLSGVNYGGTTNGPAPKSQAKRNPALLAMAKDRPCLLRVPLLCQDERETVVAAHSNKAEHGKAGARKADDQCSVWACWRCHHFIDQGKAPGRMKDGFWAIAHLEQVLAWRRIVADPTEPARFRKAAQWALDQLGATPVGETR